GAGAGRPAGHEPGAVVAGTGRASAQRAFSARRKAGAGGPRADAVPDGAVHFSLHLSDHRLSGRRQAAGCGILSHGAAHSPPPVCGESPLSRIALDRPAARCGILAGQPQAVTPVLRPVVCGAVAGFAVVAGLGPTAPGSAVSWLRRGAYAGSGG